MFKRLMAVMLVAALAVAFAAAQGVAEADEPDYTDAKVVVALLNKLEASDDMKADFLALPVAAQQAVVNALVNDVQVATKVSRDVVGSGQSSTAGEGVSGASAGDDCHSKHASRYAYAIKKSIKIWKYTSKTYWCYDGTEITNDPHFTTSGKIYGLAKLFWDYEGDHKTSQSGGEGDSTASDYAEGHFTLDLADISVEVKKQVTISGSLDLNWYPSIWKYINGDGSWKHETDLDHD